MPLWSVAVVLAIVKSWFIHIHPPNKLNIRATGVGPISADLETAVLPLNYALACQLPTVLADHSYSCGHYASYRLPTSLWEIKELSMKTSNVKNTQSPESKINASFLRYWLEVPRCCTRDGWYHPYRLPTSLWEHGSPKSGIHIIKLTPYDCQGKCDSTPADSLKSSFELRHSQ